MKRIKVNPKLVNNDGISYNCFFISNQKQQSSAYLV